MKPWDEHTPGLVLLREVRPGTRCETIHGSVITRLAGFDGTMPKMQDANGTIGYMTTNALVRPIESAA